MADGIRINLRDIAGNDERLAPGHRFYLSAPLKAPGSLHTLEGRTRGYLAL